MPLINSPPQSPVDELNQGMLTAISGGWRNFFNSVFNVLLGLTGSGLTAQRPTSLLWIGRPFFDTTLGIPIWVQSLSPTVWCDATGLVI